MMSTLHRQQDGAIRQFTKGAPDEVLKKCTHYLNENGHIVPMTDEYRETILEANRNMAGRALRVLAAALRDWSAMPEEETPELLEHDLCFIGLTGMIDPVRPEVKDAIIECRSAGIRPIMITGDHIDTARAIANELGILDAACAPSPARSSTRWTTRRSCGSSSTSPCTPAYSRSTRRASSTPGGAPAT